MPRPPLRPGPTRPGPRAILWDAACPAHRAGSHSVPAAPCAHSGWSSHWFDCMVAAGCRALPLRSRRERRALKKVYMQQAAGCMLSYALRTSHFAHSILHAACHMRQAPGSWLHSLSSILHPFISDLRSPSPISYRLYPSSGCQSASMLAKDKQKSAVCALSKSGAC